VTLGPNFQSGSITNLTMLGGTLLGTNTVTGSLFFNGTINGAMTVAPGSSCYMTNLTLQGLLTIANSATLNLVSTSTKTFYGSTVVNNGTVAWSGGTLYCNNNTVITNNGTWLAQTDDQIYNGSGGSPTFYNYGSFTKSPTTGTTTITSVIFDNFGTVTAQTGTISFDAGVLLEGTFTTAANATINLNGGTFVQGPGLVFSGAGLSEITSGNLTLTNNAITNLSLRGGNITLSPTFQNGSITNLTMLGGTLLGTNTVTGNFNFNGTVNGAITIASGSSCYITNLTLQGLLTVANSGILNFVSTDSKTFYGSTVVNNGTVAWGGGTLYCNNTTVITNNGTWLAQTDDQIYNGSGGSPTFYNYGSFTKSPTTGTTTITSVLFDDFGTINALTGTIALNGGGYLDGSGSAATGAQILLTSGTFTYGPNVAFSGPGTTEITGGFLQLTNNPIPNLFLAGGTITLGPVFQGGTIKRFQHPHGRDALAVRTTQRHF
jgi:hypothetical protein